MKTDSKKKVAKTPKSNPLKKQNHWKNILHIIDISIWVGAVIIASQFIVGFLMLLLLGRETFEQPVPTAIYSALTYVLSTIIIIFVPLAIASKRKKDTNQTVDRTELGLRGLPTWVDIGLAPAGFFAYLLLAAGITAIFSLFPWFNAEQVQEVGFSTYIAGFDRIVAFLTLVVVAPIFEEIIFRGWLYGKMRKRLNQNYSNNISMAISIFVVSLLFGLIHMQWNVGVNVFAMSIVLCGMREITGTIYSGIILHMLKNGIAFYLLYVLGVY